MGMPLEMRLSVVILKNAVNSAGSPDALHNRASKQFGERQCQQFQPEPVCLMFSILHLQSCIGCFYLALRITIYHCIHLSRPCFN